MERNDYRKQHWFAWQSQYPYELGVLRFGRTAIPVYLFLSIYGILLGALLLFLFFFGAVTGSSISIMMIWVWTAVPGVLALVLWGFISFFRWIAHEVRKASSEYR